MRRPLQLMVCLVSLGLGTAVMIDAQGPVSGVFFNEGWESGSMTQSFNSQGFGSLAPPQFSVSTQFFAPGGLRSLRHHLTAGMTADDVAYATQHFGDARTTPVLATGAGQHFYDLYVQYKVYYSSDWDISTGGPKMIELGTEDERGHPEICCNPWAANAMVVYPAFGRDWNVEVVNKQGPGNEWIAYRQNASGYNSSNRFMMQVGRWHTIEARRRLNDAGVDNGILQMWVDGTLILNYSNVRFRVPYNGTLGVNMTYGTNWVMISEYGPSSRDQSVYYDDFKLSTTYIGAGTTTPPPAPPTNVRIMR